MTLIESIKNEPDKWILKNYTLKHECGAELWIGNGRFYCQPYPGGAYGILEKFKAWKTFKWWCKNAPVEIIGRKR